MKFGHELVKVGINDSLRINYYMKLNVNWQKTIDLRECKL